jgi:hypothetical protein
MNIIFKITTFNEIKEKVLQQIYNCLSVIDGYLIEHIINSNHYNIIINNDKAGYFSIFNKSMITQYYLDSNYSLLSQKIFDDIKRMEQVQYSFVPTSNEFFLSHAIDNYLEIQKQAYFFCYNNTNPILITNNDFIIKCADKNNFEFIK